ncbi:hypothetical protein EV651_118123 [Kribbella sp. VKM Ac-2571]|uniref:hypothetical protein n=1 Tax=Kribbella sp. VKM Ac-2571 TaxID=2512222 RepID=UPI00105D9E82|nr:hypothetical protein [Kribbella sp. VKM Ac-2571]TDO52103.1 hypothetical protein EV651_118123 [Kribbella sp. VKM Ac-2571]
MTTDIERLLAAAADDSEQPLTTGVDDLLVRARRSVRKTRIATISTAVLTTGVIIAGVATWSANRNETTGPADGPRLTLDPATGRVIKDEAGAQVQAPPPVSQLSDADLRVQCKQADKEYVDFLREHGANPLDKGQPLDARWKVVVKAGTGNRVQAMFLSPDQSIVSTCTLMSVGQAQSYGRVSTKAGASIKASGGVANRVPDGVREVLVDVDGQTGPRQALLGENGFYSVGFDASTSGRVRQVRGYDEQGRKVFEYTRPSLPTAATERPVPDSVTVKTAEPITPNVVLTKDPLTGKALAPPPPVSPLTDEQITTRCRQVDDIYFNGSSGAQDPRIKAAGPVTKEWQVALKTGIGNKLTAVLISPDKKVYAWCHMLASTAKGAYDYTRSAVQANGKFADDFSFGMVPDGVAQIVVDLPKQGPTRALISNGYYIWGLTGGNSDIKNVRVRGYDAQGKQVYTAKKDVDADFD